MTNLPIQTNGQNSGRQQTYMLGAVAGLLFGLLSAYMFNRASGDKDLPPGTSPDIKTGELIGLGLAGLAMIRQIAEMGRPELKQGKRR